MELALRNSLDEIFDRQDRYRGGLQDAAALERKVARRLALFQERRETLFRPVMDAVGGYLMTKGFEYEILICEADGRRPSNERESRFSFHVVKPPRRQDLRDYPSLSVVCDPYSNTVRFRAGGLRAGRSQSFGTAAAMSIEEVDLSVFQKQTLAFLAAVFG